MFCWTKKMLTYEQLEPYIYKWAHYFREKYNRRFEVDELVNEVWAHGKVQHMESVRLASHRAKFDMMDYVRKETNGRIKVDKQYQKGPIFLTNADDFHDWRGDNFWDTIGFKNKKNDCYDEGLKRVDDIDEINDVMQFPSEKQKKYMDMYFLEGKNQSEIASELGIAESTVYKHIYNGIVSCQRREHGKTFYKEYKIKMTIRNEKRKHVGKKN